MKDRKPAQRSTDAVFQERVTEVQKFLLNGYTRGYIVEYAERVWNIENRQADSYIAKATETINEINLVQRDENLANITTNLWELFRNAKNNNEVDLARKIIMDIAKLRGLDEQTLNHFVSERPLKDIPLEDIKAALKARAKNGGH